MICLKTMTQSTPHLRLLFLVKSYYVISLRKSLDNISPLFPTEFKISVQNFILSSVVLRLHSCQIVTLTQMLSLINQSYNSSLTASTKYFNRYLAVHYGELKFYLQLFVEMFDNIVNYCEDDFTWQIHFPHNIGIHGTLEHLWDLSIHHIWDCTVNYDSFTPQEEKRTERKV